MAYKAERDADMDIAKRVLHVCELAAMVVKDNGGTRLLTDEQCRVNLEFGPTMTTNATYWGLTSVEGWNDLLRSEITWVTSVAKSDPAAVTAALEECRATGWNSSASALSEVVAAVSGGAAPAPTGRGGKSGRGAGGAAARARGARGGRGGRGGGGRGGRAARGGGGGGGAAAAVGGGDAAGAEATNGTNVVIVTQAAADSAGNAAGAAAPRSRNRGRGGRGHEDGAGAASATASASADGGDDAGGAGRGRGPRRRTKCRYYGTPEGCRRGGECPFKHVEGGAAAAGAAAPSGGGRGGSGRGRNAAAKGRKSTVKCKFVNTPDGCGHGENCRFMH